MGVGREETHDGLRTGWEEGVGVEGEDDHGTGWEIGDGRAFREERIGVERRMITMGWGIVGKKEREGHYRKKGWGLKGRMIELGRGLDWEEGEGGVRLEGMIIMLVWGMDGKKGREDH